MSDDAETLQHLLAFLDECLSQSNSSSSLDNPLPSEDADAAIATRKHSRLLAAKSRYRDRVRDEHSRLRNDVLALEATLAQLQSLDSQAIADESTGSTLSHAIVQVQSSGTRDEFRQEYKRRKRSEALNHELKDLLVLVQKTCGLTATAWSKVLSKEVS